MSSTNPEGKRNFMTAVLLEAGDLKECEECKKIHSDPNAKCKCGACLYANAKQIEDDMYPIFECKKCGARVFWD